MSNFSTSSKIKTAVLSLRLACQSFSMCMLAEEDNRMAYKKALNYQRKLGLTSEEKIFAIYAHLLKLMFYDPNYLDLISRDLSEADNVVKIWSVIIEEIFRDDQLVVKWGETFSKYSTETKNIGKEARIKKKVGDKVDFRIILKAYNVNLLNGEIANNHLGSKYFNDNRKLIREAKNIADQFYRSVKLSQKK